MEWKNIVCQIFVYVIVVSPIFYNCCEGHGITNTRQIARDNEHAHETEPPCAVCPRDGVCVPRIQCPAVVRAGSLNPRCHLEGTDQIGVCCFTGDRHAAEADMQLRSSNIDIEDIKAAHSKSQKRLDAWLEKAKLLSKRDNTIVPGTSPSFGHHLSMITHDERAEKLGRGGLLNLLATKEMKDRSMFSDEELTLRFTSHTDVPFCPIPTTCLSTTNRYRSMDGTCNNPEHPDWGAANTAYGRLLPPGYSDGMWAMRASVTGIPLPSARAISVALLPDGSHPSPTHNLMFMQFGQFIAHDITAGVVFTTGNGSAISCCTNNGEDFLPPELQHEACAPILSEPSDPFYGQFNHRCINFVRGQIAPSSDCSAGYANQMNGVTHYPDLSHLYGSTISKATELRAPGGLLKVFNDYGRELPPLTQRKECLNTHDGAACFESGDNHGNQIISLTVLHTIWTREHNRIARALSRLNPNWDEDTIFWETRRIVQAEYQHIIYNEWLPLLLGPKIMRMFSLSPSVSHSNGYDAQVNPSLTAEFASSAMRFGHSTVDGKMMVLSPNRNEVYEMISTPEVMFQPARLRVMPFLDRMMLGLAWQPMQAVDPFVTEALSRYMFHGGSPFGLDLAAINIQRSRDFGIQSYNQYRILIGLEPFKDFQQFSTRAAERLSSVYASPEDIDLWIGGLLERTLDGGVVGPTFANIIADQFSRLKRGDRYFYEFGENVNPGAFTKVQLAEIKKVSFARIICDNSDGIELSSFSKNGFLRADLLGNEPVPCNSPLIPSIDLTKFQQV